MENPLINWESDDSHVMINPRMAVKENNLLSLGLKGHLWVATSGTSGRHKWAALSKKAFLCSAAAVNRFLQSNENDRWLHSLPDFHVGGIGIWARAYLSNAEVILFRQKWNPLDFHQMAVENQITLTALVPAQVYDLVTLKKTAPTSLRCTVIGGGAISRALFDQANALGWNLRPSYGMTECCSQIATASPGDFDKGKILDHIELKIDQEQIIWIKSDALLTGYANGNEIIDPKIDGWFKTEDRGELEGGYTEVNSKFGFWPRRLAADFEPASLTQLVQVECRSAPASPDSNSGRLLAIIPNFEFTSVYLKVFGRGRDFVKIKGESVNLAALQKIAEELRMELHLSESLLIDVETHPRDGYSIVLRIEGSKELPQFISTFNTKVMPYEKITKWTLEKELSRTPLGKLIRKNLKN